MIRSDLIQPLPKLLADQARRHGSKPVFVDDRRALSYSELDTRTARLAGHLAAITPRSSRALVLMGNRVEAAESYLALVRAGLAAVCVNPAAAEPEVAYQLDHSGAGLVVTDGEHRPTVARLLAARPGIEVVVTDGGQPTGPTSPAQDHDYDYNYDYDYETLATTDPATAPHPPLALDDLAYVLYTSGTTGRPKGVMLSQRNLLWVVATCWAPILGLGPGDRLLSPLPLFHSYALDLCVLGVLATGSTVHLMDRFATDATLDRLRAGGFTVLAGVPTMFQYLLNGTDGGERFPDLARCVTAGAIMPASVNTAFEDRFGVRLLDGYGITETATMVTMNHPSGSRIPGSCGIPVPGVAVRLVDPTTGDDVGPGIDGEIWVSSPGVMLGYLDNPEATAEAVTNGWYHTGDLARRDPNGFLTISGRTKELIIRGGENIYPAEVEAAVLEAPGVADVAVVGLAHPDLGEVPVAFVVPEPGATVDPDQVQATVAASLAGFKVPERVLTADTIPRTGSGKTKRFELVARLDETDN